MAVTALVDRTNIIVDAGDLLSEAQRLSDGPDVACLMDWYARRCEGRGSRVETVLQVRTENGHRWQLTVPDADELPTRCMMSPPLNSWYPSSERWTTCCWSPGSRPRSG